jgi:tryptophan halogenase
MKFKDWRRQRSRQPEGAADFFCSYARIVREDFELFPLQSWLCILIGQNVLPSGYDPMADTLDPQQVQNNLDDIRAVIRRIGEAMPLRQEFINQNCSAFATSA